MRVFEDHSALAECARHGSALCTIVGMEGSYSRRLGAQLAVGDDGRLVGSLADGCLERELATQVRIARADGSRPIIRYGKGSVIVDFRLPCGSTIDILVDPFPDQDMAMGVWQKLQDRREAGLPLPTPNSNMLQMRQYRPPPQLLVFGDGAEVEALATLAETMGISCTNIRKGKDIFLGQPFAGPPADRWTAIILLFHDHEWELPLLRWALEGDAYYIGAQGGEAVRAQRIGALKGLGYPAPAIDRIVSPVGLIPKSRDAATLALSILADVVLRYEASLC